MFFQKKKQPLLFVLFLRFILLKNKNHVLIRLTNVHSHTTPPKNLFFSFLLKQRTLYNKGILYIPNPQKIMFSIFNNNRNFYAYIKVNNNMYFKKKVSTYVWAYIHTYPYAQMYILFYKVANLEQWHLLCTCVHYIRLVHLIENEDNIYLFKVLIHFFLDFIFLLFFVQFHSSPRLSYMYILFFSKKNFRMPVILFFLYLYTSTFNNINIFTKTLTNNFILHCISSV